MKIKKRQEWKANKMKRQKVRMRNPEFIILHHAAGYDDNDGLKSKERVKEIQTLHQTKRNWSDIGYHFLIDSQGQIFQGREYYNDKLALNQIPEFIHGAHVKNSNSNKIGICLLGCFHPPKGNSCNKTPSPKAITALVALCNFLCTNYNNINSEKIKLHKDYTNTSCPGDNFARLLPQIIQLVNEEQTNK